MITKTSEPEVLYFGCLCETGHYLHRKREGHSRSSRMLYTGEIPWGVGIDGPVGFDDRRDREVQNEGRARLSRKGEWTLIAFWDRSVDHRGGSHSTFLARGEHDFATMVRLAREQWPEVWARFRFDVTEDASR